MLDSLPAEDSLAKDDFDSAEDELRESLLAAQFALAAAGRPLYIVVAGVDGAGKGALVNRLCEWMDPRGIQNHAFSRHSDEEESRPYFWRFWRTMPKRDEIG
ncbi:MAG: polyphosphate:AMP phosphotransferase, partial [Pseudomonadota bacterium]